jgi:hypothetical protein
MYVVPHSLISGSADTITPLSSNGLRMYNAGFAPKLLPVIQGGWHCGFQDTSVFGCDSGSLPRATQLQLTRRLLTAFFELYLRGNLAAWDWVWGDAVRKDPLIQLTAESGVVLEPDYTIRYTPTPRVLVHRLFVRNKSRYPQQYAILVSGNQWRTEARPCHHANYRAQRLGAGGDCRVRAAHAPACARCGDRARPVPTRRRDDGGRNCAHSAALRGILWAMKRLRPISFAQVAIEDAFWTPRQQTNRTATLPHLFAELERAGNIPNLRLAADGKREGYQGPVYMDSDLYKALEAAAYVLQQHPDDPIRATVDEVIGVLERAQQPDGYLNSYFQVVAPDKRWSNLRDWHELYCAGHLNRGSGRPLPRHRQRAVANHCPTLRRPHRLGLRRRAWQATGLLWASRNRTRAVSAVPCDGRTALPAACRVFSC